MPTNRSFFMRAISKLKTFAWFLSKPNYYSQIPGLIKHNLVGSKEENTAAKAEAWYAENAISTEKALQLLTGKDSFSKIQEEFAAEFKAATQRQDGAPVKMGGAGNIDLLYNLCEFTKAEKVIETGVAYGWSSFAILMSLNKRNGKLCSVDMPYAKMGNEDYVGVVVPDGVRHLWNLIRLPDRKGLKIALKELPTLDLCHYDSDKTYRGRKFGYPLLWDALKPGGIFISDDIQDNFGFRDFCQQKGLQPIIVSFNQKYIGVVKKA